MSTQNKNIVRRWFGEVWNKGREDVIDEILDQNVVGHGLFDLKGNEVRSFTEFKIFFNVFRQSFPDISVTIEDTVAENDKVVALFTVRGIHTGDGIGFAPTNKPVEFTGMLMVRFHNGKIVEAWNCVDMLTMINQIGASNSSVE